MTTRARSLAWGAVALTAAMAATGGMLAAAVGDDEPRPTTITMAAADPARPGEQVHLAGRVRVDGGSTGEVPVQVQQRAADGSWRRVATAAADTDGGGLWDAWVTTTGGEVRAVVDGSADVLPSTSPLRTARVAAGVRSLADRSDAVGDTLGADVDDPAETGEATAVDLHTDGAIVATGTGAWVVRDQLWAGYDAAGGPDGRLGVPLADAVCGLPGGGCVQRFAGGAVYHAPGAPEPLRVAAGDPDVAAFEAVARAQVGYVEPSWRGSRWNAWIGNDNAWCGIFQSWVSGASGNDAAVPLERSFEDLVATTSRDTARLSDGPVVGSLAFMDLEDAGHPTHVGLVTGTDGDRVQLVEGNVGPQDGRAVVEMTREAPPVDYYWLPRY